MGVEGMGEAAVEQVADESVAGDAGDVEEGLPVGAGLVVLHGKS